MVSFGASGARELQRGGRHFAATNGSLLFRHGKASFESKLLIRSASDHDFDLWESPALRTERPKHKLIMRNAFCASE